MHKRVPFGSRVPVTYAERDIVFVGRGADHSYVLGYEGQRRVKLLASDKAMTEMSVYFDLNVWPLVRTLIKVRAELQGKYEVVYVETSETVHRKQRPSSQDHNREQALRTARNTLRREIDALYEQMVREPLKKRYEELEAALKLFHERFKAYEVDA